MDNPVNFLTISMPTRLSDVLRQRLLPLVLLALSALYGPVAAAEVVMVSGDTTELRVGPYLRYLEDESRQLSFEQVVDRPITDWQRHQDTVFNKGYTDSVFWLAFDIQVAEQQQGTARYFLEFGLPFFGMIDFYLLKDGELTATHYTGLSRPLDQRPYPHESFVFPLELQPEHQYRIMMRGESVSAKLIPLTLRNELTFHQSHLYQNTLIGFYLGLSVILALYNFFLYLSTRDINYLFYTIHVFGLCWLQASLRGFTATYVWGEAFRDFAYYEPTMIIWISFCTSLLFTRSFLKLKTLYPRWNLIMTTCLVISAAFVGLTFVAPMNLVLGFFNLFSPFVIMLVISVAVYSLVSGNRAARFFLLGWSFFLASAMTKTIYHMGFLPTNFLTLNPMIIGSALEGVLLSLALADRINWIQKEKEQAQQEAVEALERSNKIKDDFLITISHELRTPLAGIVGALSLSKNSRSLDDFQSNYQLIEKSTNRMSDTIDSILSLTEISTGDIKVNRQPCHIASELKELLEGFDSQCREKQLAFNSDIQLDPHQQYVIDSSKLTVILTQLLQNAVNFTRKGQVSLQINATEQSQGIEINIYDTGEGIPEDQLSLIFEAFQQLSGGYARAHEGLGIGLTLCRRLTDLMGGTLKVQSKLNMGTHVTVTLPAESVAAAAPSPEQQQLPTVHTLVVEDNLINQKVLTGMLNKLGCTTTIANNGKEALDQVASAKPDIVFMDCQMPVMDGIEATRHLRETFSDEALPIIAVTANALSNDRERCFAAGMNDYLVKPVKLTTIKDALQKWACRKKADSPER